MSQDQETPSIEDFEQTIQEKVGKIRGMVQNSDYEITEYEAVMNALVFSPVAHDIFDDLDGSYDGMDTYPSLILRNISKDILEKYEVIEEFKEGQLEELEMNDRAKYLPVYLTMFFTVSSELISNRLSTLLQQEFIESEFEDSDKTNKLLDSLSRWQKEELAHRTGLISGNIKSTIKETRRKRNNFIHDINEQHKIPEKEYAKSRMRDTIIAINTLSKKLGMAQDFWINEFGERPENLK